MEFIKFFERGEKSSKKEVIRFVNIVRVMERFHWDYLTFQSQPSFVITNLMNYLSAESDYTENKIKT